MTRYTLEVLSVIFGASTGALAARGKRMDLFGVVVLGLVAAMGGGTLRFGRGFVRAILKSRERTGLAVYGTGRSIRIVSTSRYPVQVDGDAFGATPLAVEIAARQVELIVPESEGER